MTSTVEVVRLGGSQLVPEERSPARDDLRERLVQWRRGRAGVRVWIAGTGAWGDRLRQSQHPLGLSNETCHWAAISLMSASARLAADLLGVATPLRDLASLTGVIDGQSRDESSVDLVFDAASFLRTEEPALSGPSLPREWSVTSDSIAARVAAAIGVNVLTLIKSCPPPATRDVEDWRRAGLVDAFFPQALPADLEIRWVDLSRRPATERRFAP